MRVMLAQINTRAGDISGNLELAKAAYLVARDNGADLIVFPELTITGYPPEDLVYREEFLAEAQRAVLDFAAATKGEHPVAVIGCTDYVPSNEKPYNAAFFCADGEVTGLYHKRHLPNYGVFDEKRYFMEPVMEHTAFTGVTKVGKHFVGVTICEDAWVDPSPMLKQTGWADLLVNMSASPYHVNRIQDREVLMIGLAKRAQTPIVYVNLVGGQDELVFDGGSFWVDAEGTVIGQAEQFREDLLMVEIPLEEDDDLFGMVASPLSREEEIWRALVLGTRDYVQKNGFKRVLIGLSGGIDSALVAAIAAEALDPENVIGVLMPSRYSSEGSITDAMSLAKALGIRSVEVPISGPHEAYDHLLKPVYEGLFPLAVEGVAEENIQARIRGNILMALSNKSGAMVLTTGNKSEMAMGYATLYGDMAGGFAVLKDVSKTDVFAVCKWFNHRHFLRTQQTNVANLPFIPKSIIEKPPSAELRPDQKDTDSLPEYSVLDPIISLYVENNLAVDMIAKLTDTDIELVRKICWAIDRNEYKRRQAPPGIRITYRAFGKDYRQPITNGWKP